MKPVLAATGKGLSRKTLVSGGAGYHRWRHGFGFIATDSKRGALSTCGMLKRYAGELSIFPFILRGVSLLGVDSVEIPAQRNGAFLDKVASDWALPI